MDNKALTVTLVVVFIGGLLLGSASFGGLSGSVVRGSTAVVSVSPSTVERGGFVDIYVNPGSGADTKIYFFEQTRYDYNRVEDIEYCRSSGRTCKTPTTYSFRVPSNWQQGTYCARVYASETQYGSNAYAEDCFNVM